MSFEPIATIQKKLIELTAHLEKPVHKLTGGKLAGNSFISAVKVPYIGTKVKIIKENDEETYIAKINPDGSFDKSDFRILCTTDLHIDTDYELNNKTFDKLITMISELKPDLIVFTGDAVLSQFQRIDAAQFAELFEKMGIYWAYTFGNHEARAEKEYFKYIFYKLMVDSPYCLSKFGNPDLFGYGNFFINIMDGEDSVRQSLVFFDSGRDIIDEYRSRDGVSTEIDHSYDYIKPSQIKWYTEKLNGIKAKYGDVKSMIFQHIPVPEYESFFDDLGDNKFAPKAGAEILYGTQREGIGCSKHNSGLFAAMKENGTQAMFCGHDHCNDFCAKLDGVYLVYNQTGGYNTYPNYEKDKLDADEATWPFGINYIDVKADGSINMVQRKFSELL